MTQRISRQALYALVWSQPIKTAAGQFKVSDVALAKACRKANIPVPPRGYWARLAAGQKPSKVPLPKRALAQPDEVRIGGSRFDYRAPTEEEILASDPKPPVFEESMEEVRAQVERRVRKVTAPRDLRQGHRLVAEILKRDDERRQKQAEASYLSDWYAPYFASTFELRRLRIINALFLALAWHGAKPYYQGRQAQGCGISIGDIYVGFTVDSPEIVESMDGRDQGHGPPRKLPNDQSLVVRASHGHSTPPEALAGDAEDGPLERKLRQVVVELLVRAEENYRRSAQYAYEYDLKRKHELIEEIQERKAAQRRAEEERLAAERQARIDELLDQAKAYRQANDIRAYVDTVLQAAGTDSAGQLQEWVSWARERADEVDPVRNGRFLAALSRP
ncbi:MAG TPA: hypothetical protein VFB54_17305 [Burkholderiales bacterium]|nr:hypothetical protein [Burkholderiales bacterium]